MIVLGSLVDNCLTEYEDNYLSFKTMFYGVNLVVDEGPHTLQTVVLFVIGPSIFLIQVGKSLKCVDMILQSQNEKKAIKPTPSMY